jgi:hypothetical protein
MLAFFIVNAILIGLYGLIHYTWNKKREDQDRTQPEGIFSHDSINIRI